MTVSIVRILLCASFMLLAACAPDENNDDAGDRGVAAGGSGGVTGTGGSASGGAPSIAGGSGGHAAAGASGTGGANGGTGGNAGSGGAATGSSGGSGGGGTGGLGGSGGAGTSGSGGTGTDGGDAGSSETCPLPTSFKWTSSGPLAEPQSPAGHKFVSLKDFTIVRVGDEYAIYATAFDSTASWTGVYIGFSDWSDLGSATQTWLGNRAAVAPQLMYFTPKDIWVLTYQWGFQYATSTDPTNPTSWSQGKSLLTGNPTSGQGGTGPIDQSVICDDSDCYLFFAGDNGRIYRGSMPIDDFPSAFTNAAQIMQDTSANLFEAVEVYSIKGADTYLMIVEAMGGGGRFFRAFTADSLGGTFTAMPQASSENTPFAGKKNVTFDDDAWTNDISHGDIVREDPSEKKPIDPCHLLFLYQGRNPTINVDYGLLPYRPGLLTATQ
jgi:hypothetical protein